MAIFNRGLLPHMGLGASLGAAYGAINPDYGQSRLGSAVSGAMGGAVLGGGTWGARMGYMSGKLYYQRQLPGPLKGTLAGYIESAAYGLGNSARLGRIQLSAAKDQFGARLKANRSLLDSAISAGKRGFGI